MRKQAQKIVSSVPPDWHRQEVEGMIRGWLGDRKKRGYGRDLDFLDWAEKTTENAKETLIHLLRKYQIQPFDILEILALYKSEEWFHTHLNVRRKLRSKSLRDKDALALDEAISILDEWWSYLTQETHALERYEYPQYGTYQTGCSDHPAVGAVTKASRNRSTLALLRSKTGGGVSKSHGMEEPPL